MSSVLYPAAGIRGLGAAFAAALIVAVAPGPALAAEGPAGGEAGASPATFAELVDGRLPSVVNVSTIQRAQAGRGPALPEGLPDLPPGSPYEEFFRQFRERQGEQAEPRPQTAMGSGFIVDPEGLVVTNRHVVEGAEKVQVILHDDRVLDAEIVGEDEATDLALLRVRAEGPLPAAPWGDSAAVRVGDWVVAIGNPFGLGGTVTAGILSARKRDINQGPYDEFLQTDAAINRGNSGGPLFDMKGQVIGINTAIFSPTGGSVGIGFAVPSTVARPVIEQIRLYGKPRRGWLGVQVQPVTEEIADTLGMERPQGALVTAVTAGGPAEGGGVRQGDVILSFDGRPIEGMRELPRTVAGTEIGRRVSVEVLRAGRRSAVEVVVGSLDEQAVAAAVPGRPEPPAEVAPGLGSGSSGPPVAGVEGEGEEGTASRTLGLALSELDEGMREAFDIPADVDGVVVTEAEGTSVESGISPGDVIVEVGQEPVVRPEDVSRRVEAARDAGRGSVLMLLNRAGEMHYVPVPVEP
jgi:serine protease Do